MNKFFKRVFWWERPKAGFFFGEVLCALLIATLPLAMYALFVADWGWVTGGGETLNIRLRVVGGLFVVGWLYALALRVLYSSRLFRRSFRCSKPVAVVCGVTLMPVAVGICAARQRHGAACALFGVWLLCVAGAVAVKLLNVECGTFVFALVVATGNGCGIAAARVLPWAGEERVGAWIFMPVLVMLVLPPALRFHAEQLEQRVTATKAELERVSGFSLNYDMWLETYTNGIPLTSEPLATLLSPTNRPGRVFDFPSPYFRAHTPEESATFHAFVTTNAALVAMIDEATTLTDFQVARQVSMGYCDFPLSNVMFSWRSFYDEALTDAVTRGDMAKVMEVNTRMIHLRDSVMRAPVLVGYLMAVTVDSSRLHRLAGAFSRLPEAELLAIQAETRQPFAGEMDLRRALFDTPLWTLVYMDEELEKRKIHRALPVQVSIYMSYEKLSILNYWIRFFTIMNETTDEDARVTQAESLFEHTFAAMRLPLHRTIIGNLCNYLKIPRTRTLADAAITVELHRRAHGAFPEMPDGLTLESGTLEEKWLDETITFEGYRIRDGDAAFSVPVLK